MTRNVSIPGLILSGTHSGVGKTTVSFVLMSVLAEHGFAVQPFKIGPDFIDTAYHRLATGRESINLDLWMTGLRQVRSSYARCIRSADVAIVEGLGALFDGENGTRDSGTGTLFTNSVYNGHSALMGKIKRGWRDTDYVLTYQEGFRSIGAKT